MTALPDLEAWAIFAKVAEKASFNQAAYELALSRATVSKAVARLEARIGLPLFHRSTRRLSLTEAGHGALAGAVNMLAAGEVLEADAIARSATPRGLVRMAAPMSFGLAYVCPILPDFLAAFPGTSIDLVLSDAQVDIIGEGFDLALRIAALADSALKARRLCHVRRLLVGTPAYIERAGRPMHPQDLERHVCLGYAYLPTGARWRFVHASGAEAVVLPTGPLRANNADALTPALLAGLGLAIQPEFIVYDDVASGSLVSLMEDWSLPTIAINLVTPPGFRRPPPVTTLIDFLIRRLPRAAWALVDGAPA